MATECATPAQYEAQVAAAGAGLVVVNFWADWAAACQQMTAVSGALRAKYPQVTFLNVEAEKVFELSEAHAVESVPTFVLLTAGKEVGRITGADVPGLTSKVEALAGPPAGASGAGAAAAAAAAAPAEDLDTKLKRLVAQYNVMLFMKGDPDEPRCGFSRKACGLLKDAGIEFGTFDILSDEEVRQGLKEFSNWPTYPQLYAKGKLMGGLDIMQELGEGGELADALGAAPAEDLDTKLKRLVGQHNVMLFMKGDPDEPRCGFSRKACGLLKDAGIEFGTFDILSDEEVRQGLKEFSNWPTYPQLYAKGKLMGGLDIMQELAEGGELAEGLAA